MEKNAYVYTFYDIKNDVVQELTLFYIIPLYLYLLYLFKFLLLKAYKQY